MSFDLAGFGDASLALIAILLVSADGLARAGVARCLDDRTDARAGTSATCRRRDADLQGRITLE